ncbi:hypothetical protein WL05_12080 [Burkholderia ubonensis]|uniref:terpene synthase family protein n=1 Tax=Burkholderia ubonensis TaxID=101571 RepID=UPI000754EA8D|nr:hypothetical protein [Burkholderia ubonensis]KVM21365.1 hypothetical protein WJ51_05915 [Burkholderia ubonensis]KVM23746.1 hypothetical protein WJ52_02485 [Burkholderia ubonensis]KVM48102.1 hypothetical protein WJ56_20970 [Burkholderia ubonensis]KVX49240.1 hypothetical protein WL05_12080 [Burkholderia ubonensis]KWE84353.1 hypothetical protein WL80_22545 [Burkholderia ubonensis]
MNALVNVPPLYCPFKYRTHPGVAKFDKATAAWLDYWELYWDDDQRARMIRDGWGLLAALAYPTGTDELIQIAADWMAWAFAWDDEWCDESPVTKRPDQMIPHTLRCLRALEAPEFPVVDDERYALSMQELRRRLDACAPPEQVGRVVEAQRYYFTTEIVKATYMSPSLSDAAALRLGGGGGLIFPVLRHVVAGVHLSQNQYLDRRIVAMTEMAATLVIWGNEFYSYAKEALRSSVDIRGHNLVDAVRREYHLDVQDALRWFARMHDRVMALFARLREQLLETAPPEVERYIAALIDYVTGILQWHQVDERYRCLSPHDTSPCFSGGGVSDTPSDESTEPVPIASMQWWWCYDPLRDKASKPFDPRDRVEFAREAGRLFNARQEPYMVRPRPSAQ